MKFNGEEIGERPTMMQVEIFIAEKGLFVEPKMVFDYWDKKQWLTTKGLPVKTLEAAISVVNGIAVQRKEHELYRNTTEEESLDRKSRKKARKARREEFRQEVRLAKKRAKEISYERNQPKPYIGYLDQLNDNRWKAFRWFVMKVRGEKCEICGSTKCLQVHHTHYDKNCKAWEYSCRDVLVVCRDCHKKIHKIQK